MQAKDLARHLGELASEMAGEDGAESTLAAIVQGAVRVVPGARWAGISLAGNGHVERHTPTNAVVAELDRLQTQLDEGPCRDRLRGHRTVHIDDMATEQRWPRFVHAARTLGVASMLSFQLYAGRTNLGALNLYATEASVFDDESFEVGRLLAQHASVALATVTATAQLEYALGTRDLIGQAKGLLMERFDVSGLQAFTLLTRLSQTTNTKLVEIARQVVGDHEHAKAPRSHQVDRSNVVSG